MMARSIRWPAKEAPRETTMLRCSTKTWTTLRSRRSLSSSIAMPSGTVRRSRHQPVARGHGIGEQLDGFRRQCVDGLGIRIVPAAAHGGIAQEGNIMASMRGIDRGCQTCLFGDQSGDREVSNPRNHILEEPVGVAGRLRPFEYHIGSLRLEARD